jgi:hypothetical protein
VLLDALDLLHAMGRDQVLARLGVPPAQAPSSALLTDPGLRAAYGPGVSALYGLLTSPATPIGPYVVQRFQRALLRRWVAVVPDSGLPGHAERVMAGDLLRSTGLLPAAALVANPGTDAEQYNWQAAPSTAASFWSPGPVAISGWDALFQRAGAFDVGTASQDQSAMLDEVAHATAMGVTLAVNGYIGHDNTVVQSSLDHDLTLIDTYPWDRIAAACGVAGQAQACSRTQNPLALIEREVRPHLQVTRPDDSVVGYWVSDDDPGDVRSAIELIHRLVQEENLLGHTARPTLCGFGGDLTAGSLTAAAQARFDQIASNLTSAGCDAVALYPYARTAQVDESVTSPGR